MRAFFTTVVLTLAASSVLASAPTAPSFLVGGVQVNEPDAEAWAESLRQVGLNTVAVTVYARQGDWDSDQLWFGEAEPAVIEEIRAAKARGLAVVLVLRVALQHGSEKNKFLWHGQIMPATDALIDSWFEKYTAFVVKWARTCDELGVDMLAIGSEMKALVATLPISRAGNLMNYYGFSWYQRALRQRARKFADEIEQRHLWVRGYQNYEELGQFLDARYDYNRAWARQAYLRGEPRTLERITRRRARITDHWIRLIARAREVYDGKLAYAANFDSYDHVAFWSHLDVMGINAYFSLRGGIDRELDSQQKRTRFTKRWNEIFDRIDGFKRRRELEGMPVVFTELGYTYRRHSTVEPWAHDGFSVVGWKTAGRELVVWGEQPVDYEERTLALGALQEVHRRRDSDLAGILYWKLSTDKAHEAIEPFVLHVGPSSVDPSQEILVGFGR